MSLRDSFFWMHNYSNTNAKKCLHSHYSSLSSPKFSGSDSGSGWWKEWGDNLGVLATGSGDIFGFCFVCFAFGGGRFLNRDLWVCGVGGGDMQRVSIYRIEHLRLFFGGMMGQRTARIASSNTVFRPFWVRAEHSRYLTAPISLAMASPCG